MNFNITLIRHGKTFAIENNIYCGQSDISISKNGIQELIELKEKGVYPQFADSFYITPLKRTLETLNIIYPDINCEIIENFMEKNLGAIELLPFDNVQKVNMYNKWLQDKTGDIKCPGGGESENEFKDRIHFGMYALMGKILENAYNSVVVVTHGSVIAHVMETFFPNKKTYADWQPKPSLGYTIKYIDKIAVKYTKLL